MLCRVGADTKPNQLTALLVEADRIDWQTLEPWHGLGMRGNNSMPMRFSGLVPEANRLGDEHAGLKYLGAVMMPVVALMLPMSNLSSEPLMSNLVTVMSLRGATRRAIRRAKENEPHR